MENDIFKSFYFSNKLQKKYKVVDKRTGLKFRKHILVKFPCRLTYISSSIMISLKELNNYFPNCIIRPRKVLLFIIVFRTYQRNTKISDIGMS